MGTKTHTLTINEIPAHDHQSGSEALYNDHGGGTFVARRTYESGGNNSYRNQNTSKTGGGAAHNNIQPSRIVNFIEPNFQ
ncbi:phage baseplate protein [Chryseobacterium sp. 6424]|uniref:phage baseplate protein n=1 Tax=Chryseobacterium sp. 6424 TaxID=2039166 RepID=UPI003977743D